MSEPDDSRRPETPALQLEGALWLQSDAGNLGGHARIALLEQIRACGSITAAAKAAGMSYKAAWDAVDAMNNLAGEPLVVRSTGGKGGGGTALTERAIKLIEAFRAVEREHRKFLARIGENIEQFDDQWRLIGRLAMRTSARNQLFGTVSALRPGAVNDEVQLSLPGGQKVVAVLTRESTAALGLRVGSEAFALIKASWVMLMSGPSSVRLSARNQLAGVVESITRGAVNAEVTLALPGGTILTAVVTNDSVTELGLAEGEPAVAAFKASSVILGVSA
ncbi:transcriptional regulator ModE family [Pandoraea thiooxydans]|uniref:Molybdenum-dependent transcriptional regulator n=1 Tax=Pandoraea thiooxydans TaxID=445709 RepID=A0A0G3ER75_9BURK|nr:TOBE domain-containing protein [Pandoraea thiooxydans]AKJ69568.1 molybdenum-dependent transcriptional regulator [Pandoraea thiooxydans]APR97260.1 transcriptional regulator ModE family [Pandoraea thiooxydans]